MNDSSHDTSGRICIVTTVSLSIRQFYCGQLKAMLDAGLRPTVICAYDPDMSELLPEGVEYRPVGFTRTMNPVRDLGVLWQLFRIFRRERFSLVQYSTPKASLLGSIAAFLAGVPIRIYLLWGLYYMGQQGTGRRALRLIEKLVCSLSTYVMPISKEMIDFAEKEGLVDHRKCQVMYNGSACGVDLELFDPDRWRESGKAVRVSLGIPDGSTVIGAVARLTGDKGINELVAVFDILSRQIPGIHLLLVGDQEQKNRLQAVTEDRIRENSSIHVTGWQSSPLSYYAAMDIFCLPTYREGFGEVNLEAQAMGLPVVSTDVIGPRESVENGVTGFLVRSQSTEALLDPLKELICNTAMRVEMGRRGRRRVELMFDRRNMIKAVVENRLKLVSEHTGPRRK